jgi:hypothetical protein
VPRQRFATAHLRPFRTREFDADSARGKFGDVGEGPELSKITSAVKDKFTLLLVLGNALVALLAVGWTYASTQYDWLNVGGRTGNVNFWYYTNGLLAYATLILWVLCLLLILPLGIKFKTGKWRLLGAIVLTVLLGPAITLTASWFFHLGFPLPPPM